MDFPGFRVKEASSCQLRFPKRKLVCEAEFKNNVDEGPRPLKAIEEEERLRRLQEHSGEDNAEIGGEVDRWEFHEELVDEGHEPTASEVVAQIRVLLDRTESGSYGEDFDIYSFCHELKEKLDNFTILVSVVGPTARKEAVEANAYEVIRRSWKWPTSLGQGSFGQTADDLLCQMLLSVREASLRSLNALLPGFPESVNVLEVAEMILSVLKPFNSSFINMMSGIEVPESLTLEALKVMKNVCIGSEKNRATLAEFSRDCNGSAQKYGVSGGCLGAASSELAQPVLNDDSVGNENNFVDSGNLPASPSDMNDISLVGAFCSLARNEDLSLDIVRPWCEALAAFLLNDDRSVVLNRAEERTRLVAENGGLDALTKFLTQFNASAQLNPAVIATSMMASNNDNRDSILEAGAIGGTRALELILQNFTNEGRDRLVLNAILCLRNLSNSPGFDKKLGNSYAVKSILAAAKRMKERLSHVEPIMSVIAHITIRSLTAMTHFLRDHGVATTLEILDSNKDNPAVLRSCVLILGNVGTYGGEEGRAIVLEQNGEAILRDILIRHPELGTYVKVAFRDIGLSLTPISNPSQQGN